LTSENTLPPDLIFVLGNARQDSGVEPTGRRSQTEPVIDRDEIDLPFLQFLE
jgi:hypothetical protein